MASAEDILEVIDRAAIASVFPMLDNGYVYLAACRLSAFSSDVDWALVIEVFDFSPRAGLPDLSIWTFASRLRDRNPPENYVSRAAYENYLRNHPNDDARFFHPIEKGTWQDAECEDLVADCATEVLVRGRPVSLPSPDDLLRLGITLSEPPRICVFELCRFLAATHREQVLATPTERRVSVPKDLTEVLVLDEWQHPDLASSEPPSATESFGQLARVLASGDPSAYRPVAKPNTHWRNWPEGGNL